jgi:hypothetical protein
MLHGNDKMQGLKGTSGNNVSLCKSKHKVEFIRVGVM